MYSCTHVWQILFIYLIFKDIPLLDCVGLRYPCCYHSFHLGICILRFIDLSSFIRWHWLFPVVMWTTALVGDYQGTFKTQIFWNGPFIPVDEDRGTWWSNALILTSLVASMTVNALVTGSIVFRIFKVFCEVKDTTTSDEKSLGVTRGRKLHSIIFIIIESGMALFDVQLALVVLLIILIAIPSMERSPAWEAGYGLIVPIYQLLNVITSSVMAILCFTDNIDLVRV